MSRIINLFAGPGAGKSTLAALVFAELKTKGHNAELVPEFAKELTWAERMRELTYQPYVFGQQYKRIRTLYEACVDYIVVDSPLLLSCVYGWDKTTQAFRDSCYAYYREFDNDNWFVLREKDYLQKGRTQSKIEAVALDDQIAEMLNREYGVHYQHASLSRDVDFIVESAVARAPMVGKNNAYRGGWPHA